MNKKKRNFLRLIFLTTISACLSKYNQLFALEKSKIINPNLSDEQKKIMFGGGTELAGSSALNFEKRKGSYHCANCNAKLFESVAKYDSGTGWPSFYDHVTGSLEKKLDFSLIIPRTEYHCSRCGGHQGHVFKDGPAPTFLRWCNNGLALNFRPRK